MKLYKIKHMVNMEWKKKQSIKYSLITIKLLNEGTLKVFNNKSNKVRNWVKKAICLYIYKMKSKYISCKNIVSYDKFKNKFIKNKKILINNNIRITALSLVRYGAYIKNNVVLMPCFVNIGAFIDKNCTIDTWSTIGSCAQIGKNVHISGGVGIGGVIEPIQSKPVLIKDNCFIGARSEIVEGVVVGRNSILSMGVFIGKSTKIFNRVKGTFCKNIPSNSVVVPGSINFGKYSVYAVIIIKKVSLTSIKKTKLNKYIKNNENT